MIGKRYIVLRPYPRFLSANLTRPRGLALRSSIVASSHVHSSLALLTYPFTPIISPTLQLSRPVLIYRIYKDYRATATVNLEEARKDLEVRRKIKYPLRVL